MPQHKSCEKRMRTSAKRNLRNRAAMSNIRTLTKKIEEAKSSEEGAEVFRPLVSSLDHAVKSNLLHKNNVARRKSRAQKLFSALS